MIFLNEDDCSVAKKIITFQNWNKCKKFKRDFWNTGCIESELVLTAFHSMSFLNVNLHSVRTSVVSQLHISKTMRLLLGQTTRL